MRLLTCTLLVFVTLGAARLASAQVVVGYTPAMTDYGYGVAVSQRVAYAPVAAPAVVPTTAYYAPAAAAPVSTCYAPPAAIAPTTAYYAPAVVPTTTYYAPAVVPTTTYYAPAVVPTATYYAPAPVTTYYAPAVTSYYAPAVATVPVASPLVYARTKYYVTGEPVRNFFRAITP